MKQSKTIIIVSSLILLTACQKQPTTNEEDKVAAAKPAQSTSTASQETAPVQSSVASQLQPHVQPTPVAEKVDLSQAHDINLDKDLSYFTPLFLAKTRRKMTDDEKLGLISAEYYNERDSFKKRDLAAKLLPEMQQQFEKYKGTYIAKIPIYNGEIEINKLKQQQKAKNLSLFAINAFGINTTIPYNFDTKSFTLICDLNKFVAEDRYGSPNYFRGNKQGIGMGFMQTINANGQKIAPIPQEKCDLLVPDETMARKIENAKSKNLLGSKGDFYVELSANDNELIAKPIQATIRYLNSQTNETLATKEFHW